MAKREYKRKYSKEFEIKLITEYFEGTDKFDLMHKYDISMQDYNRMKDKNHIKLTFDELEFKRKLWHNYLTMGISEFCSFHKLSSYQRNSLNKGIKIRIETLINILNKMELPYTSRIEKAAEGELQSYRLDYQAEEQFAPKRPKQDELLKIEKEDFAERYKLIDIHKERLYGLVEEHVKSIRHQTLIKEIVNILSRESLLVGIKSTQKGYGDKLEQVIALEMRTERR